MELIIIAAVVLVLILIGLNVMKQEKKQIVTLVTQQNVRTMAELVVRISTISSEKEAMERTNEALMKGWLPGYTLDTENRRLVHKDDAPAQPNEPSKEGNICCPGCGAVCNTTNVCSYCGRLL